MIIFESLLIIAQGLETAAALWPLYWTSAISSRRMGVTCHLESMMTSHITYSEYS